MLDSEALDIIGDATMALNGIGDLLICNWKPDNRDMHAVDPQNLERLLDLVRRELERGCAMLERQRA